MNPEDKFDTFRKMVQRHIQAGHSKKMRELLVQAIGDRREYDVTDILAAIEIESGWSVACDLILDAEKSKYTCPVGIKTPRTKLEPLKYREVIFSVFYASGFEPVDVATRSMIEKVKSCESMSLACTRFRNMVLDAARKQFNEGDTLFFDPAKFGALDQQMMDKIQSVRHSKLFWITPSHDASSMNIASLWCSEIYRRHLVDLGIKGILISDDKLHDVLSVIRQVNASFPKDYSIIHNENPQPLFPSNDNYDELHKALIDHNLTAITDLGSAWGVPVLNNITNHRLLKYREKGTSLGYKELIHSIHSHVLVRSNDSITILQLLLEEDDIRVLTPAITALSNFYSRMSITAIMPIFCRTSNPTIIETCIRSIKNLYTKCPEILPQLKQTMRYTCQNHRRLRQLVKEFSKRGPGWYYKYY